MDEDTMTLNDILVLYQYGFRVQIDNGKIVKIEEEEE